jgi:hypothetical protein
MSGAPGHARRMKIGARGTETGARGIARGMRFSTRARAAVAVTALATGTVLWAWLPAADARAGARPVLVLAALSGIMTVAQLITDPRGRRNTSSDAGLYEGALGAFARRLWVAVGTLPWPQAMTVAALVLEALHPARPWHTVVLGVVLLGFLFALHLAETATGPAVLRPQLPVLTAGLALAALSAGAAALPAASSGSGWPLAVIAAVAALLVAALALPI